MGKKIFPLLAIIIVATLFVASPIHASPDTFGKTNVGALIESEWTWGSKLGSRFQCLGNGTVTQIDWYGHIAAGYGSRTIYAAIYNDSLGAPKALLGYASTVVSETWQWWSFTGLSVSVLANRYYWLVINWNQFNIEYRYDAGTTKQYAYQGDQRDSPPPSNSFGSCSYRNRAMSIYATYRPSGPDTKAPTYSKVGINSTLAGSTSSFRAQWGDDFGLSGFIFGTNITGTWQNDTWKDPWTGTPTSGWSEVTKTLSGNRGIHIGYRFWCNDTSNNWADTGIHLITTTYNYVRAVVIHSDFSYMLPGDFIDYSDAVVFGILQGAGIPYDIRPANQMADIDKLKEYSLIVFPLYLAYRLPDNITNAVLAACNDGVGVWAVDSPGATNEAGQERSPMFISRLNNVIPVSYEDMTPKLFVKDTYLIAQYYSSGELVGERSGSQSLPRIGVFNSSRPYHETVSVFSGGSYKGAAIVTSTLGNGRTVWSIGDPVMWQAQGILKRLVRWATKSPIFLELADSPATGVSLQLRIDGDILDQYPQTFREFMWKIGNITNARMSLYIVSQATSAEEYLLAKQYPQNEYGSHSKTHSNLPALSPADLQNEMNGSKIDIEAELGWSITGFAYPFNSYTKNTTAAAGAYDYVYIGMQNNMSVVYPNSIYLQRPPNAKTTALDTYSVFMTALDDYGLFTAGKDGPTVLQIWKSHFNFHIKQARVSESSDVMCLLWHIKEMGTYGISTYFDLLDWAVNKGAQFITAQKLVNNVKELEAVNLEYKKSGNIISVILDGSLTQGYPLRLFNSSDNIQSVTIDGQPWTNFRDKLVVLPSLGLGEHSIELRLGLVPTATIRGTVADAKTGNPINGVNVTCDGASTLTALDGTYSFTVNLGLHTLTFKKASYIDQIKNQDCPTQGEYVVDILLQPVPTATIRGIVVDSQTANPIEGVDVTCDGKSTFTALDGSYSFTVTLGSYMLTFRKTGYITENRTQSCPTEGEYIVNVSLQPVPTATIRGVVTDSGTGNPIQGVNVTCDGMSTLTASDGTYSFKVNLGSYILIFSKIGYATETRIQDCPTVGEYVVDVSLRLLTATLRGTVTDSKTGASIGGVNVTVDGTISTLTASDGTYSFTVILGLHTLTFKKAGYVAETRTQNCPAEGTYIVDVVMTLVTATIRGTVTDSQTGVPIGSVNVTCNGASILTAADGSYSFIVNLGLHSLTFRKTEYVTETRNQDCPSEGVYIVNMALTPRLATITGTVTDSETGMPVDSVKVTTGGYQAFTNSSGVYVLVVRLGSYTLTFDKSGYYTKTTTVNCPTEGTYRVDTSLTPTPPPSVIFASGFETGNLGEWDRSFGSVAVVSDVKYAGTYSLRATFTSRWQDVYAEKGGMTANPVYFRFYARFSKLPLDGRRFNLAQIYDSDFESIAGVRIIREGGNLYVRLSRFRPTAVGTNYRYDFAINTWYCFELKFYEHASAGEYRLYVNGQEVIVDGGLNTSGSDFRLIRVGHSSDDTGSLITWFDEVKVASAYIGPAVPTATIRGVVTDSGTGNPIGGVTVTIDGGASTLTASDGSYSFTVNLGSHTLTYQKVGYVTETRTQNCPTKGDYVLNVALVRIPTATIRGNVTDSTTGAPIAGVNVTVDGRSSLTASNGSYSFTVNLGSYTLTFSKVGYVTETRNQDCPSEGVYVVNVALTPRLATITGTVTDSETGMPVDSVKVTTGGYQAFTNSSGVYVLVVRLGSYTLTFDKSGYYTKTTTVNCPTEGTYTVNMMLTPTPPPSVIFTSGFETGDYSEWTGTATEGGATITLVSDISHHGSYSSRATFTRTWQGAWAEKYGLSANPVYIRWYARFDTLPGNDQAFTLIESIDANWNTIWDLDISRSPAGKLRIFFYRTRPGEGLHYYEYPFEANTWYCFEVKFYLHASAGEYRVYLNGVEVITLTEINTSGSAWKGVRVGRGSGYLSSLTIWTDCVKVADAYIGPEAGGQTYVADLSQGIYSTWTPLSDWNVLADTSQKITSNWVVPITWNTLIDLMKSISTSWQIFAQAIISIAPTYLFYKTFPIKIRKGRRILTTFFSGFSELMKASSVSINF